jgi:hypothetical protein
MSVDASEWLKVGGRLNWQALLRGTTASQARTKFAAWLEDAALQPGVIGLTDPDAADEATRLWVDYRAKRDGWEIRNGTPVGVTIDGKGATSYTQAQIDAALADAEAALAAYQEATAGVGTVSVVPANQFSRSVRASFEF